MPRLSQSTSKAKPVTWLSEKINYIDLPDGIQHNNNDFYHKFRFKNMEASIGDFILVLNADAAEPDTEDGSDAAQILALYENPKNDHDPYRAKVQWYSTPNNLPPQCLQNCSINFLDDEVVEDHRPFDNDISIETIFKKCTITKLSIHTDISELRKASPYNYICRYKMTAVSKRKVNFEPILERERVTSNQKTPSTISKKLSRISLGDENWHVAKTDGTKLQFKRSLFGRALTPKKMHEDLTPDTPRSSKKEREIVRHEPAKILSMELRINSNEDIPTLVITQSATPTVKSKCNETETPTKSGFRSRRTKKSLCYEEESPSPIKGTPRRATTKRFINDSSDDDFKPETPKNKRMNTPRTRGITDTPKRTPQVRTPQRGTPRTPRSAVRRIQMNQLTPSLKSRANSIENINENPDTKSLPGREKEMAAILSFVRNNLLNDTSGCMYISGVPGTGKTATVNSALQTLQNEERLPHFQLVEINGMAVAEPRQAFVQIYKQLTGKLVKWEQAHSLLEKRFTKYSQRRTPTVLVVDELDALCTRRLDVIYSMLEWGSAVGGRLSVLSIANTLDLPERALAGRVGSRAGVARLSFPAYTHAQLATIVRAKLSLPGMSADAIQLVARKVAAASGDARRALALCSRAVELSEGLNTGLKEVEKALAEACSSDAVSAIKHCCPAEKLILRAVAAEMERTGSGETTLQRVLLTTTDIVALEGRQYKSATSIRAPTHSQSKSICSRLASANLLNMEPKAFNPKLSLIVNRDDVYYATRQIG